MPNHYEVKQQEVHHDKLIQKVAEALYDNFFASYSTKVRHTKRSGFRGIKPENQRMYLNLAHFAVKAMLGDGRWKRVTRSDIPGHVSFYQEEK